MTIRRPPSPAGGEPGEEVGEPRWVAGGRRYAFCGDDRMVLAVSSGGLDTLWLLDLATGERSAPPGPAMRSIEYVAADGDTVVVVGGVPDRPSTVWRLDLSLDPEDPAAAVDLRPVESPLAPDWVSLPTPVTFPTGAPADLSGRGCRGRTRSPTRWCTCPPAATTGAPRENSHRCWCASTVAPPQPLAPSSPPACSSGPPGVSPWPT